MLGIIKPKRMIIDGHIVYIRGLTYEEFTNVLDEGYESMLMLSYNVAYYAITDIDLMVDGKYTKYDRELHFEELFADDVDFMRKVTEEALKLTVLTDEEKNSIKGMVAFSHYIRENSSKEKEWDCKLCIKNGKYKRRVCNLLTEEEVSGLDEGILPLRFFSEMTYEERTGASKKEQEVIVRKEKRETIKERKARRNLALNKKAPEEQEKVDNGGGASIVLNTDYFKYTSCPVSIVHGELRDLVSIASRSLGAEELLVEGGLFAQPHKFLEVRTAIRMYQDEMYEIDREKDKQKSKNNK